MINIMACSRGVAVHIITGSFQGRLRVYLPQTRSFQAEDALLEVDLHSAILQLEVGRFHR